MAMIAVQVVLEKLASFVAEETRFLGGVRGGIVELQDDLYSMKSFLQDAEERSESDQGLRAWVKQVRDVAYDADVVYIEEKTKALYCSCSRKHALLNFNTIIYTIKKNRIARYSSRISDFLLHGIKIAIRLATRNKL